MFFRVPDGSILSSFFPSASPPQPHQPRRCSPIFRISSPEIPVFRSLARSPMSTKVTDVGSLEKSAILSHATTALDRSERAGGQIRASGFSTAIATTGRLRSVGLMCNRFVRRDREVRPQQKEYRLLKVVTQAATEEQITRLGNDRVPILIPPPNSSV